MPPNSILAAPDQTRTNIQQLKPYIPGRSIEEIRNLYGCERVIKMASNENPLGTPPLAQLRMQRTAALAFRYPQGGNPRLVAALAARHGVAPERIVLGNGSDELIDLLMRVRCEPGKHTVVSFKPCFGIYPVQAQINGLSLRQVPLNEDFSFPLDKLRSLVDDDTALVFLTTPDNPSGYCPDAEDVLQFARSLPKGCLLVVDEAYMDFAHEQRFSLLAQGQHEDNIAFMRTFSKSFGLAGMRLGYGILPGHLAQYIWRARLPFSVNLLAEEAGLAALEDTAFYTESLRVVKEGRQQLHAGLEAVGCHVWPSHANFIMFAPPTRHPAAELFEQLLKRGFILRPLNSYELPHLLRISVGTKEENKLFLQTIGEILA